MQNQDYVLKKVLKKISLYKFTVRTLFSVFILVFIYSLLSVSVAGFPAVLQRLRVPGQLQMEDTQELLS